MTNRGRAEWQRRGGLAPHGSGEYVALSYRRCHRKIPRNDGPSDSSRGLCPLLRRLADHGLGCLELALALERLEHRRVCGARDVAPGPLLDGELAVGPDHLALA